MTKKKYLNALNRSLRGLNAEDRRTILDDYREHFRQGAESGQSESDIIGALGTPESLAEEARSELGVESFRDTPAGAVVRMSMASISLLLFNAILVVGPYAGLVGALAGLWATAVAVSVSGIAVSLSIPLEPLLRLWVPIDHISGVMPRIAVFFGGISMAALGALAVVGMVFVTRWFIAGTVWYAKTTWRIATK